MAWKEYFIYNVENTALVGGTGVAFTDTIIRFDSDADFELMKRSHVATDDRINVRFKDDAYGRELQNVALDLRTISGTRLFTSTGVAVGIHDNSFLPYILSRPFLIRAATAFTTSFADFSGANNSVRLSLHGAKLRMGIAPWEAQWKSTPYYDYSTGAISIAANGSAFANISLNIDAHFLVQKITATRIGSCLLTVKDGGVERQWMNTAVHIDNFAGNSQFPNILPAPRFVYRGSTINITIQDISGLANSVNLVFTGMKLF